MKPQAYQPGEMRDENDNIIRAGSWGKKMAFATSDNKGILDYIINNFDAHERELAVLGVSMDEEGNVVLSPFVEEQMTAIKTAAENARNQAQDAAAAAQETADNIQTLLDDYLLTADMQPIENETIAEIAGSEYVSAEDAIPLSFSDIDSVFS